MTTTNQVASSVRSAMRKSWEKIAKTLPEAPTDGRCTTCGWGHFILITEGFAGIYNTQFITEGNAHWHSFTNGWDDIDDSPLAQWLACTKCDTAFATPTELGWN